MKKLKKLRLTIDTVKFLKLHQLTSKVGLMVKTRTVYKVPGLKEYTVSQKLKKHYKGIKQVAIFHPESLKELSGDYAYLNQLKSEQKVADLVKYKFTFLNQSKYYTDSVAWNDPNAEKLWLYNLHYFDYSLELGFFYALEGNFEYYHTFKNLVQSWIKENPIGSGNGWEPYTLSLRICNWIQAYFLFKKEIDLEPTFKESFLQNLFAQVLFLEANLEYHLYGNHLFENARALTLAGIFFAGEKAEKWLKKGLNLLTEQLEEQVLPDGGHFERSPMYHLIVLKGYVECLVALEQNNLAVPVSFRDKLEQMFDFLLNVIHPDKKVALLNDSAFKITLDPIEILPIGAVLFNRGDFKYIASNFSFFAAYLLGDKGNKNFSVLSIESPLFKDLPDTGYYIFRENPGPESLFLIYDCGEVGPDYIPGHAHADTFNYELSAFGERWIVDSGVYEYPATKWREYFRSTKAHNTIEINGKNQSEVWSSFRVAKRVKPKEVRTFKDKRFEAVEGSFEGYCGVTPKVGHKRIVIFVQKSYWIILDMVEGNGTFDVTNYLHFEPEKKVNLITKDCAVVMGKDSQLTINYFGSDKLKTYFGSEEPLLGWYSDEFGKKVPTTTLASRTKVKNSAFMGYVLSPSLTNTNIKINFKKLKNRIFLRILTKESGLTKKEFVIFELDNNNNLSSLSHSSMQKMGVN